MRAILLAVPLALALATGAVADHCDSYSTSSPESAGCWWVTGSCYYQDSDLCQPECIMGIAFYEETNDYPGLQRQDDAVDDTCHGLYPGDRLLAYLV